MATAGVGSRRSCEKIIEQGRVTVNGKVAKLGMRVDTERDQIRVDGARLSLGQKAHYVVLNKPVGVVTSLRPQGGKRGVLDLVPEVRPLHAVGRLDADSEGLLVLTSDGDLTYKLTHPRFEHEKEYRVLLDRRPDEKEIRRWREGLALPGGALAGPVRVEVLSSGPEGVWLRVIMHEGHKRQIRETARLMGLHVRRLVRTRIGGFRLHGLRPGEWRFLRADEVALLLQKAETSARTRRRVRATS
jgi:23S rRNA pseudouridine2605 synthase